MPLPQRARELFDGSNFATVATVQPGGQPQTSVVWVRTDGDDVLFSTIKGRRKYANLTRDPRVSVLVFDATDPLRLREVRGPVEITDDPAAELIEELSRSTPASRSATGRASAGNRAGAAGRTSYSTTDRSGTGRYPVACAA